MKILIVSPTLNHGGAERVASLWAEGFVERGHKVFFVANIENEEAYSIDKRILLLPLTYPNGNKIVRYTGAVKRLRGYYKKYRPHVIIGVMYACSLLAKLAELGLGIPVINTEHSAFEQPRNFPMLLTDRIAKYWLNYLYDGTTILTKADMDIIKNRFKNLYLLPNPTFLMPLGIVPEKQNVVFAAGRIDAWGYKGFDVLIRAWGQINRNKAIDNGQLLMDNGQFDVNCSKLTGWRLQIAGTGSEESLLYLKQLCKENGVEDTVDFLGFRKDIEDLYKKSGVFVLSSRYEGFGMVLVEAMSQGCACVACDYKGRQREILNPSPSLAHREGDVEVCENGICCEPDNVEALANSLKKMIEDEDYRKRAQLNAILRSRDYTKERVTNRWDEILNHYQ